MSRIVESSRWRHFCSEPRLTSGSGIEVLSPRNSCATATPWPRFWAKRSSSTIKKRSWSFRDISFIRFRCAPISTCAAQQGSACRKSQKSRRRCRENDRRGKDLHSYRQRTTHLYWSMLATLYWSMLATVPSTSRLNSDVTGRRKGVMHANALNDGWRKVLAAVLDQEPSSLPREIRSRPRSMSRCGRGSPR